MSGRLRPWPLTFLFYRRQVTRQVAQCKCAKRFQVEQIGENKYRVRQRALNAVPAARVPPREVTRGLPAAPRGAQPGGSPGPSPRDPWGPRPVSHRVPGRRWCLGRVCPALCPAPGRAPRRELQESIKVALFWGGQHEVLHSVPPPAALEVLLVDECTLRPCFS